MFIFFLLMIFINILGIFKKNSKVIFFLQMIFIFILLGWNTGGMDYIENKAIFNWSGTSLVYGLKSGWLYSLLSYFCHIHGIDFLGFNIICALIIVISISYVVLKMSRYPCFVALMFLIYPLMDTVIQKRYSVGMALIVLGLFHLMNKRNMPFVICVICAYGFHFSLIVFLFVYFWPRFTETVQSKILKIAIVCEIVLIMFGQNVLMHFFNESKLNEYLFTINYSSVRVGVVFALAMGIYYFLFDRIYKENRESIDSDEQNRFIHEINKLAILLVPLCFFESAFMRYYRIVLLYNYIFLSNQFGCMARKTKFGVLNMKLAWEYNFILYVIVLNTVLYVIGEYGFSGFWNTLLSNAILR